MPKISLLSIPLIAPLEGFTDEYNIELPDNNLYVKVARYFRDRYRQWIICKRKSAVVIVTEETGEIGTITKIDLDNFVASIVFNVCPNSSYLEIKASNEKSGIQYNWINGSLIESGETSCGIKLVIM